jgi:hypothetical protein
MRGYFACVLVRVKLNYKFDWQDNYNVFHITMFRRSTQSKSIVDF